MKTFSKTLVFLVTLLLIFSASNTALAGRSGKQGPGGEGPWDVDSSAKGTKLPVTIGIFYELADGVTQPGICDNDDFEVKMTFFMRLSTNKNAFPLGGDVAANICYTDYPGQQQAIETFINSAEVRDRLYQFGVISNQDDACFAIKSVEDAVDDPYGAISDGKVHYSIADFILAIDEKSLCPQ